MLFSESLKDKMKTSKTFAKNKHKCKSTVKISNDMSIMERNELKQLRPFLEVFNRDSISKTIKFINGHPEIVDIQ